MVNRLVSVGDDSYLPSSVLVGESNLPAGAKPSVIAGKVGKGELAVSVRDYGAAGNGIADDTAAVQAAVEKIRQGGGGTLYFPPGNYYIRSAVTLCSNITITGNQATLIKKSSTDPTYVVFTGSSGSTKGYGAGANNITMHGLRFSGKFGTGGRTLCALALHHSDNVLAYNNTFEQCSGTGHRFDLQGCRFVTIRDSTFAGFDTSYGELYAEDIQADFSTISGASITEANPACYDGLPSQNVTVENNRWLPLTLGATTYPAGNPFGSHGTVETMYLSDLTFRGNYIKDPVADTVSTFKGVLHFVAPRNLLIENNYIENTTGASTPAIYIYRGVSGPSLANVGTAGAASTTFAAPQVFAGVTIRGNEIRGFSAGSELIRANGDTIVKADSLTISANTLVDNSPDNTGPITVNIFDVTNAVFDGNKVTRCRRVGVFTRCTNLAVSNNTGRDIAVSNINVADSTRVTVTGNVMEGVTAYGIYITGTTDALISGNTVEGRTFDPNGPLIRITDPVRSLIVGNVAKGLAGTSNKGIEFTGAFTGSLISNNVAVGFTSPILPAATGSGATVTGNITA